jgi:hypothetical protein
MVYQIKHEQWRGETKKVISKLMNGVFHDKKDFTG